MIGDIWQFHTNVPMVKNERMIESTYHLQWVFAEEDEKGFPLVWRLSHFLHEVRAAVYLRAILQDQKFDRTRIQKVTPLPHGRQILDLVIIRSLSC